MNNVEKKTCKYCQTEISKKASICPNCRKDSRNWFNKHPIVSVLSILIIIGAGISGYNDGDSINVPITSGTCSSEMKKTVANEYKSPSTVNFISCNWDKNKGIYGEADAQNGFGGTIRTSFLCNGNTCLIGEK